MTKKISFITTNWFKDTGGGRKVMTQIINGLAIKHDQFSYSLIEFESQREGKVTFPGSADTGLESSVNFVAIPSFLLKRNVIAMFYRFIKQVKRDRPDVIVDVSGPTLKVVNFLLISLFFSKKKRPKYIFFDHNPVQKLLSISRHRFLYPFIASVAYRNVDYCASVSKELVISAAKEFSVPEKKTGYIYNPINIDSIVRMSTNKVEQPWFLDHRVPIIISCARLDPIQKDFLTLLKAFSLTRKKMDMRLVILGEGPQQPDLLKTAEELGIDKDVWFVGYDKNPYKYFAKGNIFILSTQFESFGLVLGEAMACGCPVISSDCDFGPREVLENGKDGILVPVGDVGALSDAVLKMLSDEKLREELVKNGYERVKDFSMEKTLQSYEDLFTMVLGS
jgi:glycosyltransferase involved in cell wall biosynthesis